MAKLAWEPARLVGLGTATGVTAVLAILRYYGVVDTEGAALWATLAAFIVPPLQAEITRWYVMATKKIWDAGHNPATITADAKRNTGG
jgi:hypothetical protein